MTEVGLSLCCLPQVWGTSTAPPHPVPVRERVPTPNTRIRVTLFPFLRQAHLHPFAPLWLPLLGRAWFRALSDACSVIQHVLFFPSLCRPKVDTFFLGPPSLTNSWVLSLWG